MHLLRDDYYDALSPAFVARTSFLIFWIGNFSVIHEWSGEKAAGQTRRVTLLSYPKSKIKLPFLLCSVYTNIYHTTIRKARW